MLKIHNTLSKKTEDFRPLQEGHVTMYVCGPTVYSYLHVGNFRGPVFFNFVRNWLEHLGYKVTYALNFTDVDDKILKRAQEEGKSPVQLSEFYIEEYKADFASLGLRAHDHNPKVTEYMPQIIAMIEELIAKKKAYTAAGDVNYAIDEFSGYGKLSGRRTDELREGVRIGVNENKKNALDFALWKSAKDEEGLSWNSPWGPGRPGWHIECSAMVRGLFGEQIDIHGGGLDLVFPHHENEIAQSEGCTGHDFVKYWMHVNMLNFGGTKMSKSLGNVVTMRDFLKGHHPEVYKWMILSVHYRSPADFTDESIERAVGSLAKFYSAMALAENVRAADLTVTSVPDEKYRAELQRAWKSIEDALNDDFGTPAAFAVVFEVIRKFNTRIRRGMKATPAVVDQCEQFLEFMRKFGAMLSLFQEDAQQFLNQLDDQLLLKMGHKRPVIDALVAERSKVRDAKDFEKADELRKKLTEMGITVSDTPSGSVWEVIK